jgi:hypothetical protein
VRRLLGLGLAIAAVVTAVVPARAVTPVRAAQAARELRVEGARIWSLRLSPR